MTEARRDLIYALLGAALLILLPLALIAANSAGLVDDPDGALVQRLSGIAIGLILAVYGNIAPRKLVRYDPAATGPSRRQAIIRFSGWVFVLAGLGHALVWLLVPIERAALWSMVPVAGGLALVLLRCLAAKAGRA